MSGWVERSFCTMAVASESGGVHTSSTTMSMPLAFSSFSRRGLKKKTVAAVLSPTMAAFVSVLLLRLARSRTRSSACSACTDEIGLVWNVYLRPRSVMESAYESVNHGTSRRSATSVTPSVKELSQAPMPALIFSRDSARWAALTAFSTVSPASASRRTSLAPPSALMPPCALISAMAISAPIFLSCPWRAHRPDSGATSAIFTSSAAHAAAGASIVGAAMSTASTSASGFMIVSSGVVRIALLEECPHAFREVLALADPVTELLLQRFARRGVIGDGGADLLLDRLHRRRAVGRDGLGRLEGPRHQRVRR